MAPLAYLEVRRIKTLLKFKNPSKKRPIPLLLIAMVLSAIPDHYSLIAQATGAPGDAIRETIERKISIDNFEGDRSDRQKWELNYKTVRGVSGYLTTSNLETTALASSATYLTLSYQGKQANGVRIMPPRPIFIEGYVRRIEVWVYGFGKPDELYLDLMDQRNRFRRLSMGKLNFNGWRLLRLAPGKRVTQRPLKINGGKPGLYFRGLYLKPHYRQKTGLCRVHFDDIEAIVRDYNRRPSLDWESFRR